MCVSLSYVFVSSTRATVEKIEENIQKNEKQLDFMVLFVEKKREKKLKNMKHQKKFNSKLHRVNEMVVQVKLRNYKKVNKEKFEYSNFKRNFLNNNK